MFCSKVVRKPRIDCIDGCRFALVFPIILGHFIRFGSLDPKCKDIQGQRIKSQWFLHHRHKAFKVYMYYLGTFELFVFVESVQCSSVSRWGTDNRRLLKLLTQENVLVGGFFSISGYVAAYTTTNLKERGHDAKKFKEPELFFWQKVPHYILFHSALSAGNTQELPKISFVQQIPWTCFYFDIWRFCRNPKGFISKFPPFLGGCIVFCGVLCCETKALSCKVRSWDTILYTFWSPPWALLCSLRQIVWWTTHGELLGCMLSLIIAFFRLGSLLKRRFGIHQLGFCRHYLLPISPCQPFYHKLPAYPRMVCKNSWLPCPPSHCFRNSPTHKPGNSIVVEDSQKKRRIHTCGMLPVSIHLELLWRLSLVQQQLELSCSMRRNRSQWWIRCGSFWPVMLLWVCAWQLSIWMMQWFEPFSSCPCIRNFSPKCTGQLQWNGRDHSRGFPLTLVDFKKLEIQKPNHKVNVQLLSFFQIFWHEFISTSNSTQDTMVFTWGCYVFSKKQLPFFMNFRPWCRDCLMEKPHLITRFFGSKLMTKLGALAFPMFILHGPLGQIFYKKKLGNCFFFFSELPEALRCANLPCLFWTWGLWMELWQEILRTEGA